jgi:hypothetical protein
MALYTHTRESLDYLLRSCNNSDVSEDEEDEEESGNDSDTASEPHSNDH